MQERVHETIFGARKSVHTNIKFVDSCFCIYEQNLSNAPVKELFFPVYHTPGYICDCLQ